MLLLLCCCFVLFRFFFEAQRVVRVRSSLNSRSPSSRSKAQRVAHALCCRPFPPSSQMSRISLKSTTSTTAHGGTCRVPSNVNVSPAVEVAIMMRRTSVPRRCSMLRDALRSAWVGVRGRGAALTELGDAGDAPADVGGLVPGAAGSGCCVPPAVRLVLSSAVASVWLRGGAAHVANPVVREARGICLWEDGICHRFGGICHGFGGICHLFFTAYSLCFRRHMPSRRPARNV